MIRIENLSKSYGCNKVLENISIHIPEGTIYGLVGQSGVGKSTLLRCINGLETFESGQLIVDGISLKELQGAEARHFRKDVGMIFQNFSLLNRLTLYENIALPMRCWKYDRKAIDKRVKELLELVEMSDKSDARPRELSGGQNQRGAIARALAMNPRILLCDEATSALDPKIANSIISLLLRINTELGITIVVVTHQMEVVRACCEKISILEGCQVSTSGSVEEVFMNQPQALINLIGEKRLPPTSAGKNIKILLSNDTASTPVISQMARNLNIDFTFLGGEMENYRGGILGTLIVNIADEDYAEVSGYLKKHGIKWNEMN